MKKLFLFSTAMIILNFAQAQKISLLPTATGTGKGGFVAVVQNGVTKKLLIDSLVNAGLKPLYRDLTVTPNTTTVFNFDSSTTAKLTTNGTVNIDIQGALPLGSSGVIAVTQSATGGDLLKYNNVNINIAKIANKTSLVGFVKFLNNFIFSVDTSSNIIAQTGYVAAVTFDSSAQNLFTAAGTNFSYQTAVNNAIVSLKGINLAAGGTAWSKSVLINGRAGTSLTQQSFNWKNPAQYQYTYTGAFSYNANGTVYDGTNSINTGLNPTTAFTGTVTDIAIFQAVPVFTVNDKKTINGYDGVNSLSILTNTGGNFYYSINAPQAVAGVGAGNQTGRLMFFYSDATTLKFYKNAILADSRTVTPNAAQFNSQIIDGDGMTGRIDITHIMNTKLTVSEAQQIDAIWATYETALNR